MNNQKGQGLMEYIIISCLVGVFCVVAVKKYGRTIKSYTRKMNTSINKELRTVFRK